MDYCLDFVEEVESNYWEIIVVRSNYYLEVCSICFSEFIEVFILFNWKSLFLVWIELEFINIELNELQPIIKDFLIHLSPPAQPDHLIQPSHLWSPIMKKVLIHSNLWKLIFFHLSKSNLKIGLLLINCFFHFVFE